MNPDNLAESLQARYEEIIDREMARLAHRTPGLAPTELYAVQGALRELVERLVLVRVRESPQLTGHAAELFGVEPTAKRPRRIRGRQP